MKKILVSVVLAGLALNAQGSDQDLHQRASTFFNPLPDTMPGAEQDSAKQVALGKDLYFENKLSFNGEQSCNSCHRLDGGRAGDDGRPVSPGSAEGKFGARNAPTTINAGLHVAQFWDGRAEDLQAQAKGPVLNPNEMGIDSPEDAVRRIRNEGDYEQRFQQAFPDRGLTFETTTQAIAAFERTLISEDRFDQYLEGDQDALTSNEKDGLRTFMDKGCTSCHNGALLGGKDYQKMGLVKPYKNTEDVGRMEVTGKKSDKFVFKVPSLRNVALTAPYFQDGAVSSLDKAVHTMGRVQLGQDLSDEEVQDIVAFLKTLNKKDSQNFADG